MNLKEKRAYKSATVFCEWCGDGVGVFCRYLEATTISLPEAEAYVIVNKNSQ